MIEKLIESAEQEIAICELRLEFLRNKESEKKGRGIMDALIQVTAQKRVAEEWLIFLKEKNKGILGKVVSKITKK